MASEQIVSGRRNVTVGTSVAVVSREQVYAKRVVFNLTNVSTGGQVINIAFGEDAKVGAGIQLSPGGTYSESEDDNFTPTNEQITAISSAAGGSLAVSERMRQRVV